MRLFLQYIRQSVKQIGFSLICCGIFLITFLLYHLPLEAVLYPIGLCVLAGLLFFLWDFENTKRRHQKLTEIHSYVETVGEMFPSAQRIEDQDYQRIIRLFDEEQRNYQTAMEKKYTDMIEYYTVWAHQIKTPISSMRLTLQNEDSALSRKLSSDLFRIEQYVEMVLMFLRLGSENTDYVIKEYDLDPVIRQAVKKFAGEFIDRKLRLNYEPLHTSVITDEKWMSFVIEQVLSNALKYTPNGGISITLEPEKKLCIQDTGMGIAPEDLPRIFEKGFTGYNGRSDKKASGIGLYLCKRICRNLGHSISVESSVGKGTKIIIDLHQRQTKHE